MAHTPGPWAIKYEDELGNLLDDGLTIESGDGPVAFRVIDCSAHLIAAAPEMLATLHIAADALDYAQAQVDSENDAHNLRVRLVQVKRVIAKAEGRGE